MKVRFTDFADAALRRLSQDEDRYHSLKWAISWYLRHDPHDGAVRCPAFADQMLWVRVFGPYFRVLYAICEGEVLVWSVARTMDPDRSL
jgi:hypothetical protein